MFYNSNNFFLTIFIAFTSLSLHAAPFSSPAALKQFLSTNNALIDSLIPGDPIPGGSPNERYNGVPLYQLRVLGQGFTYCGYHATKNIVLTKDFINDPTIENLRKLESQDEFDNKWTIWERNLSRCNEPSRVRGRTIKKSFEEAPEGEMLSTFPQFMLSSNDDRQKIYADEIWKRETFQNLFDSELNLESIIKINEHFSRLQAEQNDYFGIAFGATKRKRKKGERGGGHWIGLIFAKKNGEKYAFCFDSNWNRNRLNFPTIKFLTEAFACSENHPFLSKYLTTAIPAIIVGLNSFNIRQEKDRDKLINFLSSNNSAIKTLLEGLKENANPVLQQKTMSLLTKNQTENQKKLGQQLIEAVRHVLNIFNDPSWTSDRRKKLTKNFFPARKEPNELKNIIENNYKKVIKGNREWNYSRYPNAGQFANRLKNFLDLEIAQSLRFDAYLRVQLLINRAIGHIFVHDSVQDLSIRTKTSIQNELGKINEQLIEIGQQKASDLEEELDNYFIPIFDEAPTPPTIALFQRNITRFLDNKIQPDVSNNTFQNIQTNINEITNMLSSSGNIPTNQLDEPIKNQLTIRLRRIKQILNSLQNLKAHKLEEELESRFIYIFNTNQRPPSPRDYSVQIDNLSRRIRQAVPQNVYNDILDNIFRIKDLLNPHGNTKIHRLTNETIKESVIKALEDITPILEQEALRPSTEVSRETDRRLLQVLRRNYCFEDIEQLEQALTPRFGTQQTQPQQLEQSVQQLVTSLQQFQGKLQDLDGELKNIQNKL